MMLGQALQLNALVQQEVEPSSSHESQRLADHVKGLTHLGMSVEVAQAEFGDVKYVCMGGTDDRARKIAESIASRMEPGQNEVRQLSKERFIVYKVGQVITASHGMGGPSVSIAVNEILLALKLAKNTEEVVFFRIGTTGGIGVEFGQVVVTSEALNEELKPEYNTFQLGERKSFPTKLDAEISEALCKHEKAVLGKTMTADGFYENQGRLDGAFCNYTAEDKMKFLQKLHNAGVRNIEMEVVQFSALLNRAGYRTVACCAVVLNRLKGDQINEILGQNPAIEIVADYITQAKE
mmetsp:Transcript_3268/g.6235  ORF Transcript_3268/g.6235 Transcript_3268/m.6235 type:complete len:294 (-) Transcript_3268:146-1027(-)